MTVITQNPAELQTCQALAQRLPEPRDLFAGVPGFLSTLPSNPLQFHRHSDQYLLMGAPFLHHRFVLVSCLREPGCIILDGNVFHVAPGHGLLIFPYQSHYFARLEHPELISWLFTTFELAEPTALAPLRNTPFVYSTEDLQRLQRVTTAFLQTRRRKQESTPDMPLELALLLSGLLQRHRKTVVAGKPLPDGPQAQFLRPLFDYIERHPDGPLQLSELARCVHLSTSRLRARFRHTLGIGLGTFIRHMRIQRACGLLNSTDLNVTQVSEQCGFTSVYAFSRTFRSIVKKTPTAFRAQLHR